MANYKTGDIIRLTRLACGLTQEELSEGICSVETLSRIENGKHKIKKDTYRMLMTKMERIPEKNYAICLGKTMELLEERQCLERAINRFEYEKADKYLEHLKKEANDDVINQQYIKKAEALLDYYNKRISEHVLIKKLDESVRLTIPQYEMYIDKVYPYTMQEVLTLLNLANAYGKIGKTEKSFQIYKMLLRCLKEEYFGEKQSVELQIIIYRNCATLLGENDRNAEALEWLKESWNMSQKYRYDSIMDIILGDIAWNIWIQIDRGERERKELAIVRKYLRQAYYIAAAKNESEIMRRLSNFYQRCFNEDVEII